MIDSSSLDYTLLRSSPSVLERLAGLRVGTLLLGGGFFGWAASHASNFFWKPWTSSQSSNLPSKSPARADGPSRLWPAFLPKDGVDKVATPLFPVQLQRLPPGLSSNPSALFLYDGKIPTELVVHAQLQEGWLYGAQLSIVADLHLALPTGSPEDILKGRLLTWPLNATSAIQEKVQVADRLHGYDPSSPDMGLVRKGVARIVKKDGNTVRAFFYFRPARSYAESVAALPTRTAFLQLRDRMNKLDVVLASQSPRRAEILQGLGLRFRVRPSAFEENLDKTKYSPEEYVMANAREKGLDVYRLDSNADIVISADTVVILDQRILEKPKSRSEAKLMLMALSERTHTVCTGVALVSAPIWRIDSDKGAGEPTLESRSNYNLDSFHVCTEVTFAPLSSGEIEAYVATGEPMDKAGAYGIQGQGSLLVKSLKGCYFNVMGFPSQRFAEVITYLFSRHGFTY
eukprot:gb/GEZN01003433.1/.p1 GENE.gb/GEZN01003433.1/~~gb/GEZN01003433.1/.p1  ORF type:complete len:458 (-),score=43.03 gb/GEZN01003433.1/:658-2031(-)